MFRYFNFGFAILQGLISSTAFATPPTVWDSSPIGDCGADFSKKGMKDIPPEMKTIEVKQQKPIHQRYVWQWDSTPSSNPNRILYRVNKNNIGCAILFLPAANETDFKLENGNHLPKTVSSLTDTLPIADGKGQSYKIEYTLNPKTGMYGKYPSQCMKLINDEATKIDCSDAFQ